MLKNVFWKLYGLFWYLVGFVSTSSLEGLLYAFVWNKFSSKALNIFLFGVPELPIWKGIIVFFVLHVFFHTSDLYPVLYEVYTTAKGVLNELFKPNKKTAK